MRLNSTANGHEWTQMKNIRKLRNLGHSLKSELKTPLPNFFRPSEICGYSCPSAVFYAPIRLRECLQTFSAVILSAAKIHLDIRASIPVATLAGFFAALRMT